MGSANPALPRTADDILFCNYGTKGLVTTFSLSVTLGCWSVQPLKQLICFNSIKICNGTYLLACQRGQKSHTQKKTPASSILQQCAVLCSKFYGQLICSNFKLQLLLILSLAARIVPYSTVCDACEASILMLRGSWAILRFAVSRYC